MQIRAGSESVAFHVSGSVEASKTNSALYQLVTAKQRLFNRQVSRSTVNSYCSVLCVCKCSVLCVCNCSVLCVCNCSVLCVCNCSALCVCNCSGLCVRSVVGSKYYEGRIIQLRVLSTYLMFLEKTGPRIK